MRDYSHCPLTNDGVHHVDFNKFTGIAKCICGYVLITIKPANTPDGKKHWSRYSRSFHK